MKKISTVVHNYLSSGFFSPFYLLEITFGEIQLNYTDLPATTVFEGKTYSSDSGLVDITNQKMSTVVDKETFKLKFSDPQFLFRQYCDTMASNGDLRVRVGFYNVDDEAIYGTTNGTAFAPGKPILDGKDMVTIYEGYIDKPMYIISEDDGVLFELECSAPLGALDANNVLYTTTMSLKQRLPYGTVDTCFDQVALGGKRQEILWGRTT